MALVMLAKMLEFFFALILLSEEEIAVPILREKRNTF